MALLDSVLSTADDKGLVAMEIMTERYEITSILQRLLVGHEPVFGTLTGGSPENPADAKSRTTELYR